MTSLGLLLCPYRNLTTLTAAVLALHPGVQVMNHGMARIEAQGGLEVFFKPDEAALDRLLMLLITLSVGGARGDYGGSICHSHAFDHPELQAAWQSRFGAGEIKPQIQADPFTSPHGGRGVQGGATNSGQSPMSGDVNGCIQAVIWKEGGQLRERLVTAGLDPVALARRLPSLRFLSPIRHPLDHARSLQKFYGPREAGQAEDGVTPAADAIPDWLRPSLPTLTLPSVLRYLLGCHAMFLGWQRRCPGQFLWFTEAELGDELLCRLAGFLSIEPAATWRAAARAVYTSKVHYSHPPGDIQTLEAVLEQDYGHDPEFCRLMRTLVLCTSV